MTYVCSDIHGCIEPFNAFLNSIKPDDSVYVIGDAINRGGGLAVLKTIMKSPTIHMLKGNHELMMLEDLTELYYLYDKLEWVKRKFCSEDITMTEILDAPLSSNTRPHFC